MTRRYDGNGQTRRARRRAARHAANRSASATPRPSNADVSVATDGAARTENLPSLMNVYRAMVTARRIDRAELELVRRGVAFFHVSGAGHEASAALVPHLTADDWLACHYRDKAMLVARGLPPKEFLSSLLAKADSHSAGRQMSAHLSDPARNVLSIPGPVGNNALHAVGVAAAIASKPGNRIVVCSVGDGTTQEGEFLEACAEAVRARLPVLFMVEDNRWAISTLTAGRTVYSLPDGAAREFLGMPITHIDGRDAALAFQAFGKVVERMRRKRRPAFVVLDVARLHDHSNADDQRVYREEDDILRAIAGADPVAATGAALRVLGVSEDDLQAIAALAEAEVARAECDALAGEEPKVEFGASKALLNTGNGERGTGNGERQYTRYRERTRARPMRASAARTASGEPTHFVGAPASAACVPC